MQTEYEERALSLWAATNALLSELISLVERAVKLLEARPVDGRRRGGK